MQLTSIKFSLSSISMVYPYSWSSSRDLRKSRNATQLFTFMSVIISTRSSTAKNIDTINTFFLLLVSFWCLFLTTQHVRRTHDRILINDLFKFCWTHAYVGSLVARFRIAYDDEPRKLTVNHKFHSVQVLFYGCWFFFALHSSSSSSMLSKRIRYNIMPRRTSTEHGFIAIELITHLLFTFCVEI